jgi:hypothetical protein
MSARADLCGGRSAMIVPTATVSNEGIPGNVHRPECIIRSHHGSMAHHKPRVRYDARYANPQFNQYRYNYEMSFRTQN